MPRKPKNGPPILRIERLSDGIDPTQRDDTTGELLPQPMAKPPKVQDVQAEMDRRKRQEIADKALLLQAVGILPVTDPRLIEARAKPKPLAHNEHKLGQHVMVLPKRPLRRI